MTNDIKVVIEELLFYAGKNLDMYEEDYILRRNNLLDLLKVDAPADAPVDNCRPLQEILDDVNEYAAENHLAEEWEKINFETRVMGLLMPMPFQVITTFEQLAASDPALATKYLYNLSVNSNYIRKVDIDKNIGWKVANPRGDIMITINLSKPEKDPKAILAAKNAPQTAYPKCMLCKECVGFSGNAARPARQTLRTIPIILNNEVWHFQFSPYVYFETTASRFRTSIARCTSTPIPLKECSTLWNSSPITSSAATRICPSSAAAFCRTTIIRAAVRYCPK